MRCTNSSAGSLLVYQNLDCAGTPTVSRFEGFRGCVPAAVPATSNPFGDLALYDITTCHSGDYVPLPAPSAPYVHVTNFQNNGSTACEPRFAMGESYLPTINSCISDGAATSAM